MLRGLIILIISYNSNYEFLITYVSWLCHVYLEIRLFDLRIEIEHQCSSEFRLFQFKRSVFYFCVYFLILSSTQRKYRDLVKSLQVDKKDLFN